MAHGMLFFSTGFGEPEFHGIQAGGQTRSQPFGQQPFRIAGKPFVEINRSWHQGWQHASHAAPGCARAGKCQGDALRQTAFGAWYPVAHFVGVAFHPESDNLGNTRGARAGEIIHQNLKPDTRTRVAGLDPLIDTRIFQAIEEMVQDFFGWKGNPVEDLVVAGNEEMPYFVRQHTGTVQNTLAVDVSLGHLNGKGDMIIRPLRAGNGLYPDPGIHAKSRGQPLQLGQGCELWGWHLPG